MALIVPQVADDRNPAVPLTNVYAWNAFLAVDLLDNTGQFVLNVHPDAAAWRARPVTQIRIALGQRFGDRAFPTLAQLMDDDEFRAAFNAIGAKLYAAAVAVVPELAGSVVTED